MSIKDRISGLMARVTEHLLPNAAPAPSTDAVAVMGTAQAIADSTGGAEDIAAHILHSGHVGALVANVLPEREPNFDGPAERNFTSRLGHRGTPADAPAPKPYDKRIHGDSGLADVPHRR